MGKIIYNGIDCGGGGGDEITITPVLSSGTKIADYTIDGTNGSLYAPSGNVTDVQIDSTSIVSGGVANIETMTGAGSSTAGAKGLVPAPASGDNTKYLRGDGTWQDAQGASAVSDLTDVSLSSLTNGQILKYNSTSQKWENAAESGGGGSGNVDDVYVNGTSVLDTNHIAQVTSYKELTQAQYDALPASKLTDGILYCIKDTGINEGDKFTPIIYSTDEREVGTWLDGKPLYQKTIVHNTVMPYRQWTQISIGSGKKIVYYEGKLYLNDSTFPFSDLNYHRGSDSNEYCCCCGYNNYTLQIYPSIGANYNATCTITVWYTKDDEVPGSGNWTTSGVPAVHYSTDEQIIGTWIDGKTIYQKTYEITQVTVAPSGTRIQNFDITNISKIINAVGISAQYQQSAPLLAFIDSGNFYLSSSLACAIDTITLQYTKTTD